MPMYSACGSAVLPALGFPIRESAGQRLFSASPRLIAAVHALHRLLVPRHPPCALPILTVITRPSVRAAPRGSGARASERRPAGEHAVIPVCWQNCAVFKVRRESAAPGLGAEAAAPATRSGGDRARGLSKLNSMQPP